MSENMQTCPSCGELVPLEYVTCVWCGFDLTAEHIRRSGIYIGRTEAINRMRKVVRDPLTAFKEISLLPDLVGGRMILYAIAVMMTLNMLAIFSKLDGLAINNTARISITTTYSISVQFVLNVAFLLLQPIALLVIFVVVWKLSTRIMMILAKSVGGKGDYEKIRAVIGYSLLPIFFGWSLAWLIRLVSPSESVSQATYQSVEQAMISVAEQGIGVVAMFFLYIGWIWSTILGIIGMRHAARLSWIEAVLVAGIPYSIFIIIAL